METVEPLSFTARRKTSRHGPTTASKSITLKILMTTRMSVAVLVPLEQLYQPKQILSLIILINFLKSWN